MNETHRLQMTGEDVNKAFAKFGKLLSSEKARECMAKAESELAFNVEVFLLPLRIDLAECMEIIAGMIKERGTSSEEIEELIPILSIYLDPGSKHCREISSLEKKIADKKRQHPDFIHAFKLKVLLQRYKETLQSEKLDSVEHSEIVSKFENVKSTLENHMNTKIRIAQRAFEPDMLELAQNYLELSRHHEKILNIKEGLLNAGRKQSTRTLETLAKVFQDTEPELASTILNQTHAVSSTGTMPCTPAKHGMPQNMEEFQDEIQKQNDRLKAIDTQLDECTKSLQDLRDFEEVIFNSYGDQLKEKGFTFKKLLKVKKSGMATGIKKQQASRMSTDRLKR